MRRIEVALGARAYEVAIGAGLLDRAADLLAPLGGRYFLVTDANVAAAGWPDRLRLPLLGRHDLPPGEGHKTLATLAALIDAMLEAGVERGDVVLALGGGVVGDVAGLAAALVKRGCRCVHLPTSLLAQVDSSVGGKTGVNARQGKNLIGAFHQPAAVLIDPETLGTLPARELKAGYAEVVKYGLIGDAGFFAWCEANGAALIAGDAALREEAIARCVAAKAALVAADERESGPRMLLNLGHTFAHAIEAAAGYEDMLHGEAVAIGLALAFAFSAERGLCSAEDAARVAGHLAACGLPVRLPAGMDGAIARFMAADKKAEGGEVPFILARGIGEAFIARGIALAEAHAFLDRYAAA
jgi:3-dehydroquinate synthase